MPDLGFWIILGAIVGSRLLYVLINPTYFLHNPLEIFMFWKGGLVFLGGAVLGALLAYRFMRKNRMPVLLWLDVFAPGLGLGQAVGRLGCLSAGCCFGKFSTVPWAVTFTDPDCLARPLNMPLHPTQLYHSLAGLITFLVLLAAKRKITGDGRLMGLFLVLYASFRFGIEFFRGDYRGYAGFLSVTQILATGFFLLGVWMLTRKTQAELLMFGLTPTQTLLVFGGVLLFVAISFAAIWDAYNREFNSSNEKMGLAAVIHPSPLSRGAGLFHFREKTGAQDHMNHTTLLRRIPLLLLALALLAASGCVTREDFDTLNAHVRNNKKQLDEISERQTALETSLRAELKAVQSPIQSKQAELWAEAEQLKVQIARLSGQLDTSTRGGQTMSLPELSQQVEAMRFAMEHDLGVTLPSAGGAPGAANATAGAPATPMLPGATPIQTSRMSEQARQAQEAQAAEEKADPAKALYDQAMASFKSRNYQAAADGWDEFANTFKKHPMRPNAIFWKGEAYYMMGKYPEAILAYEEVKAKYPSSTKYRSALLKQGIAFYKLNKKSAGKLVLEDLVRKYPDSAEAKRAKSFLATNK